MEIHGELDVSGKFVFSMESLAAVYTYNTDGTLATETRGPDQNGYSYKKIYTWNNGVLASETGWVKQ